MTPKEVIMHSLQGLKPIALDTWKCRLILMQLGIL